MERAAAALANQLLKPGLEFYSTGLTNYGRFEGGDDHEEFDDQSRETQGQRSVGAIVHR